MIKIQVDFTLHYLEKKEEFVGIQKQKLKTTEKKLNNKINKK